jgi:hypothetical protein
MNLYGFQGGDPVNFSDPFGLCPRPGTPCPRRFGMFAGAVLNGVGQTAEKVETHPATPFVVAAVVPEATAVTGAMRLYRAARGYESATRLARQAAEAETKGQPHGISVTGNPNKFSNPAEAGPGATKTQIEANFPVHSTPSRADPTHHTVELPKPVTQAVADVINRLFRPRQ